MRQDRPGMITSKNCFVKVYLMDSDVTKEGLTFLGRYRAVPEAHFKNARRYTSLRYMDLVFKDLVKKSKVKAGERYLIVGEFNRAKIYLT